MSKTISQTIIDTAPAPRREVRQRPIPPLVEPADPPRHVLAHCMPTQGAIKELAKVTCGKAHAEHMLKNELCSAFDALAAASPEFHKSTLADVQRANAMLDQASTAIMARYATLNALKTALIERANVRREAADLQGELEQITAKLADPACLQMDAAELFKQSKRKEFLPSMIAQAKKDVEAKTAQVEALRDGFDVPAVIKAIAASIRMPDGRVEGLQQRTHENIERGFLAAD